ncbi:MAG: carbon-nitrogen hydrolase family protein [Chlorobi bacterium]|nr:carbon-nitrogen hydrolase family protein [Chlorobiota bacterium]
MTDVLKVGIAQISPIWLNKDKTNKKIQSFIIDAGKRKCDLVVFGEALLPGYPFWLSMTHASQFDSKVQKEIHAYYIRNSVSLEHGDLNKICSLAARYSIAIYVGIIERAIDRGGHSLYCSLVFIDKHGVIKSVHRKLQPTYEERLCWSAGDGNGLQVHSVKNFMLGGLNCWENWMPLARASLYAMGENVHIAVWPGSKNITQDISRFIAKEARSYVVSVSALLRKEDINEQIPHHELIKANAPDIIADGGSCIIAPDGEFIIKPIVNQEGLFVEELDINTIYEERQNFDPSGHYARPDVMKLTLNRERQSVLKTNED